MRLVPCRRRPLWPPVCSFRICSPRRKTTDGQLRKYICVDDYLTKPFSAQELRARLSIGQRILQLRGGLMSLAQNFCFALRTTRSPEFPIAASC
jgi:hypothetical protein